MSAEPARLNVASAASSSAAGAITERTVTVSGVPMSALVASVPEPRLVIVALHGGAVTSAYYDYPEHPRLSMLRAGAALGYTVIALDRPGYGASAAHDGPALETVSRRVDLIFGAVESLLSGLPRGAGVFLVAHSMGCILGVQAAASAFGTSLLGLEIAGTGLAPHPEADFMMPLTRSGPRPGYAGRPRRATLQSAMWAPAELYPPGALEAITFVRSPHYEGPDIGGWISAFPSLAASVSVPVHYTLGDHERVWDPSAAAMASVASLFTASPRVSVLLQPEAAHNLSRCRSAAAYHLKVFAFAEECALAREASGATLPRPTFDAPAVTSPRPASGGAAVTPPRPATGAAVAAPESPSLPTPPPGG